MVNVENFQIEVSGNIELKQRAKTTQHTFLAAVFLGAAFLGAAFLAAVLAAGIFIK
jgi:hypothetical protein